MSQYNEAWPDNRKPVKAKQIMTWGPRGQIVPLVPDVVLNPLNIQPTVIDPAAYCPPFQFQQFDKALSFHGGGLGSAERSY